jgi:two-component system cell cycle sensor histidine kinase/response regulator CckA
MGRRSQGILETLDRWSRFGVPDFGGDFDKARAANALNIVLIGLAAIILVTAFGVGATTTTRLVSASLFTALFVLVVSSHTMMRRGNVRPASRTLIMGLWLIFTVRIALSGGYRSPAGLSYALLCTIAGLLMGWRMALLALVACGTTLLVLVGAETLGYSPPNMLMTSHVSVFLSYSTSLIVFVLMLSFAWTRQTMDERVLAELQIRQVIEQAVDAVYITDVTGQILMANAAAGEMFGYPVAQLITLNAADTYVEGEQGVLAEKLRLLAAGERLRFERAARRKDGSTVPIEVTASSLGHGRLHAIMRDVTERKRAEAALRESEDRFRLLAEAGFEGIAISSDGRVIDANARVAEMLGYEHGDLRGLNVLEMVAPEHRDRVMEHIRSGSEESYEHLALHRDGTKVPVEIRARTMTFRGNTVRITAIRDLTDRYRTEAERVALEERLRQSQKMEAVGQLAGGVAHDFNNLLMMIGTQAELLEMDESLGADSREGVAEIRDAAKRAASLTQQLLTLSRRKVMQTTDVDLNESVTRTSKMLRRVIGEDIAIDVRVANEPLPIRADQAMLDQVLINLAVNARDAMSSGGRIAISTALVDLDAPEARLIPHARPGSFACLTVSDNGSGMSKEVLSRIFEPFFTTKGVGKGTGLGLATVDGIVGQHGGWVTVESKAGAGSTFRVYVPRITEHVAPSVTTPTGAHSEASEIVLLTEDEDGVRDVIRAGLERMGHRVLTASHAAEAIRKWETAKGHIDLLVTDIVMPNGMSGWDLARELRGRRPDLRVIYMSGYSAGVSRPPGEDADDEDFTFLQKPFSMGELADAMRATAKR